MWIERLLALCHAYEMPLTAQFPQPSLPLHADCIIECKLCARAHSHTHTHTHTHCQTSILGWNRKIRKRKVTDLQNVRPFGGLLMGQYNGYSLNIWLINKLMNAARSSSKEQWHWRSCFTLCTSFSIMILNDLSLWLSLCRNKSAFEQLGIVALKLYFKLIRQCI